MSSAPMLMQQRVLAAKVETTAGTVETLAGANANFYVMNPAMTWAGEFVERPGLNSASPHPGVTGGRMMSCAFETEMGNAASSGVDGWADALLLACGFVEAGGVYTIDTPESTDYKTVTLGLYEDGRLRRMAGAQGDLTMQFSRGNPVRCQWNFTGKYVAPSVTALVTPTYPTALPARFGGATLTVGGATQVINEMTIALNNVVTMREDVTDATGYLAGIVTSRRVTVTMDPEASTSKDWWADLVAHSTATLNCSWANIAIQCPKLQVMTPEVTDRDGQLVDRVEFQAVRSNTQSGDDELTITYS